MKFDIEKIITQLVAHPYFEKIKKIKEVNAGHTEDSIYTHLMQTLAVAQKSIDGNFLTDQQAKKSFTSFMDKKTQGILYKDVALLIALVHDIGKMLSFSENGKIFPMNIQHPIAKKGETYNPGHEYWSSTLIPNLFKDSALPQEIIDYITTVVRLHGEIFNTYIIIKDFPLVDAIRDVKARVENYHVEVLFNSYCDITYHKSLHPCRVLIEKMLNHPDTYLRREYFVAANE